MAQLIRQILKKHLRTFGLGGTRATSKSTTLRALTSESPQDTIPTAQQNYEQTTLQDGALASPQDDEHTEQPNGAIPALQDTTPIAPQNIASCKRATPYIDADSAVQPANKKPKLNKVVEILESLVQDATSKLETAHNHFAQLKRQLEHFQVEFRAAETHFKAALNEHQKVSAMLRIAQAPVATTISLHEL